MKIRFIIPLLIVCIFSIVGIAYADNSSDVPEGFSEEFSGNGVALYNRKGNYVMEVDLRYGADVVLMHGKVTNKREGSGIYGGNNASFSYKPLSNYWSNLKGNYDGQFCVVNGEFFYRPVDPPTLFFPLKVNGNIITDGFGSAKDRPLMLEVWDDHMDIKELTRDNLYNSTAPDIIVGVHEDDKRQKKLNIGRTFAGIDDRDNNGKYETLLIYTSRTARQDEAAFWLRSFGADKVMMLDGGGSTQLLCKGQDILPSPREIPQAIGILAGKDHIIYEQPTSTPVPTSTSTPEPTVTPTHEPTVTLYPSMTPTQAPYVEPTSTDLYRIIEYSDSKGAMTALFIAILLSFVVFLWWLR